MTDTPIADAAEAAIAEGAIVPAGTGSQLATVTPQMLPALLGDQVIPMDRWLKALMETEAFEETDEEDASLSIVRAILLATSSEAVFASMNVQSVKELLGNDPGARSNVFEIRSATPMASTYEEGVSCFAVISAVDLAEQQEVTLSCGARAVQAAIAAHMIHGWVPFRAVFTRRRKPTRHGFYPINLESGI